MALNIFYIAISFFKFGIILLVVTKAVQLGRSSKEYIYQKGQEKTGREEKGKGEEERGEGKKQNHSTNNLST